MSLTKNTILHACSIYTILILINVLFDSQKIIAQNKQSKPNVFFVEYIESISSTDNIINKNFLDKLSDLILGSSSISFVNPITVLADGNENMFVLDQGLQNILTIDKDENIFSAYKNEQFPSLVGACYKSKNEILFTDSKLNNVFIFNASTNLHKVLNDALSLMQPTGIGYSYLKNEIWIVETGKHSIIILDEFGNYKKRIGTRGIKEAEFNFPTSIWIDENGIAYIVDAMNYRIQIFNSDGNFLSMFGEQGDATGYLARPKGVATDSYGNIYVVDALFHTVQIFDPSGIYLSNFGTQGNKEGEFWLPNGLFIDKKNRIYVADSYNSRIQIFQLMNK